MMILTMIVACVVSFAAGAGTVAYHFATEVREAKLAAKYREDRADSAFSDLMGW